MNLWQVLIVLTGSIALSWAVVAASITLAHRIGHLDHPDDVRKIQEHPIPKLGGVAVAAAFTLILLAGLLVTGRLGFALGLTVLVPALAAAFIGFLDDRASLSPYLRLVLQAAIGLLAWLLGNRVALTGISVLDAAILILWVMVVVNGVNLLDNSDGLAGITVAVISVGAAVVAAILGQQLVALMGIALVGVSIGYLWHNWYPAKVYLGDAGAYFLGTLVALMLVRLKPESAPAVVGIAIVVLLALLPLIDTAYVVIKRVRTGVHPFTAGRDHLSHVLQGRGASVPASVLVLQLISLIGVASAILLALRFG